MSLLEQGHQEGAGVRDCYEIYENAAILLRRRTLLRTKTLRKRDTARVEASNNEEYELDGIPEADQHFFLIVQPPIV